MCDTTVWLVCERALGLDRFRFARNETRNMDEYRCIAMNVINCGLSLRLNGRTGDGLVGNAHGCMAMCSSRSG